MLERHLENYKRNQDKLTAKEQDTLRDMRIVQEMYARGFEFEPIDIYQADAGRFKIVNNKIMPSLNSIDGMGDKAAEAVVEEAKKGKFLSKEDFWQRTKVSKTTIDVMGGLGPVSYTHLDVYKRQGRKRSNSHGGGKNLYHGIYG